MRIGKFKIADSLSNSPDMVKLLMNMKILNKQSDWAAAGITEILAEFEEFDDIKEGDVIPTYEFIFRRHMDGTIERLPAIKL